MHRLQWSVVRGVLSQARFVLHGEPFRPQPRRQERPKDASRPELFQGQPLHPPKTQGTFRRKQTDSKKTFLNFTLHAKLNT